MAKVDTVIVGAGLTGAVIANRESLLHPDSNILVLEKDSVVGGLCRDEYNFDGVFIHKYGPHIFHTNDEEVYQYLSRYCEFNPFEYCVTSSIRGLLHPLPFSLKTLETFYCDRTSTKYTNMLIGRFGYNTIISLDDLFKIPEFFELATTLYSEFVEPYNIKQWGEQAAKTWGRETAKRLQFRVNYDTRYFNDKYCAIPKDGYTKLIQNLLDRKNITVLCEYPVSYTYLTSTRKIYWTPDINQFRKYVFLPYVSTTFKFNTFNTQSVIQNAQINYPEQNYQEIRVIEHKKITRQKRWNTTISSEFPKTVETGTDGDNAPKFMYPIRTIENIERHEQEIKFLKNLPLFANVHFCGRGATYQYLNMDSAVRQAIDCVNTVNKIRGI
jgi:UDP-galactopyranose mutase